MEKLISLMVVLLTFTSGVLLGFNGNGKNVNATTLTTNAIYKSITISEQAWSNKLAKSGYIFKLSKDVYASAGGLFPSGFTNHQPYSKQYAKQIYDHKMLFKIDQVKSVKNSTSVHIVFQIRSISFGLTF